MGLNVVTVEEVFDTLKTVYDPEHPIAVTDPQIGIVRPEYIKVLDGLIRVRFRPTVPSCPMGGLIGVLIRYRLEQVFPDNRVQVLLIPNSHTMEEAVNEMINNDERYNQVVEQLKARGML